MAVIQKIRDKAGLMLVLIGGAMLLFVLNDLFSSGNVSLFSDPDKIGEIDGESILGNNYLNYKSNVEQQFQGGINDQQRETIHKDAWNNLIRDKVYYRIFDRVPLGYCDDEMNHILYGEVHPQVTQYAMSINQQVGNKFPINYGARGEDIRAFVTGMAQTDERFGSIWDNFAANQMRAVRQSEKFLELLKKGMYPNDLLAKDADKAANNTYAVKYVFKQYKSIPDSAVAVSDNELKAYYNENINEFKFEPNKDIKYVQYRVKPSEADYAAYEKDMHLFAKNMKEISGAEALNYVKDNAETKVDENYYVQGQLRPRVDTVFFSSAAKEGDLIGPYLEGNIYKVDQLVSKKMLGDSAKVRHVLFSYEGAQRSQQTRSKARASQLADSVLATLNASISNWDAANALSDDKVSAKDGGKLGREGWVNKRTGLVAPFINACLNGKKGEVVKVETSFGFHLIHIMDYGVRTEKIQVATLDRTVRPSESTTSKMRLEAMRFFRNSKNQEQFDANIEAQPELFTSYAKDIKPSTYKITGLPNARDLVLWVNKAELGEVSQPFQFDESFVIACVTDVQDGEYKNFEEVKDICEIKVREQKKAEIILADFEQKLGGSIASVDEAAQKLSLKATTDSTARFTSNVIQGRGAEPELIGRISACTERTVIGPVKGETAVYIMEVTPLSLVSQEDQLLSDDVTALNTKVTTAVNSTFIEAYKSILHVKDERNKMNN